MQTRQTACVLVTLSDHQHLRPSKLLRQLMVDNARHVRTPEALLRQRGVTHAAQLFVEMRGCVRLGQDLQYLREPIDEPRASL